MLNFFLTWGPTLVIFSLVAGGIVWGILKKLDKHGEKLNFENKN